MQFANHNQRFDASVEDLDPDTMVVLVVRLADAPEILKLRGSPWRGEALDLVRRDGKGRAGTVVK